MYEHTGQVVQALAGRDKGGIFCVVGVSQERERLLLADGKRRKVSRPKAKKPGHVRLLTGPQRGSSTTRRSKPYSEEKRSLTES